MQYLHKILPTCQGRCGAYLSYRHQDIRSNMYIIMTMSGGARASYRLSSEHDVLEFPVMFHLFGLPLPCFGLVREMRGVGAIASYYRFPIFSTENTKMWLTVWPSAICVLTWANEMQYQAQQAASLVHMLLVVWNVRLRVTMWRKVSTDEPYVSRLRISTSSFIPQRPMYPYPRILSYIM